MTNTTVCLCTCQRPANLARVLTALRSQIPPVRIYLWANACHVAAQVDWYVHSSRNLYCLPRWWLAWHAATPYVLILDDDLMPAHPEAIANLVRRCRPDRCVGPFGARLTSDYASHTPVCNVCTDVDVDIIKGRCLAVEIDTLHSHLLPTQIITTNIPDDAYPDLAIAEDIAFCGSVARTFRRRHLVPANLAGDWVNLPEGPESLSRRADHLARRSRVAARWFP